MHKINTMEIKTFTWSPEYSVGVQMIDEQHQHFFEIANRILLIAGAEHIEREELFELFSELGNYALYHLGTEEKLFDELAYPDKSAHVAAHDQYRDMIANRFNMALSASDADVREVAKEMAEYSGQWLKEHILAVDKKYMEFFNEHGMR